MDTREERYTLRQQRDMKYEKFRRNIRILRAGQNLSAVEMSEKIGLHSGHRFIDLEYGRGNPKLEEIIAINEYFCIPIDHLLNREAQINFF